MTKVSLSDLIILLSTATDSVPYVLPKDVNTLRAAMEITLERQFSDEEIKEFLGFPAKGFPYQSGKEWLFESDLEKMIAMIPKVLTYGDSWRKVVDQIETEFRNFIIGDFCVAVLAANGNTAEDIQTMYDEIFPVITDETTDEERAASISKKVQFIQDWLENKVHTDLDGALELNVFDLNTFEEAVPTQPTEQPVAEAEVQIEAETEVATEPAVEETGNMPAVEAEPAVEEPVTEAAQEVVAEEEPATAIPVVAPIVAPARVVADQHVILAPEDHQLAMNGLAEIADAAEKVLAGAQQMMAGVGKTVRGLAKVNVTVPAVEAEAQDVEETK